MLQLGGDDGLLDLPVLRVTKRTRKRFAGDKKRAMAHAIANTFTVSITAVLITTVAGFVALCFMTFKLGALISVL